MSAAAGSRDPWFDNAKMVLVTLVVVAHAWAVLPLTGLTRNLYDFVYLWHMPAFVLVAGHLSRSFEYTPRRLAQLLRTVAVPYVVFEALLALFRTRVGGEEQLDRLFLDPHWPMWFLAALFCWRLGTPVIRSLPAVLPLSVAFSLTAGMWAGSTLDLARVLGMLPFFVMGVLATPERLEALRGRFPRALALLAFAAVAYVSAHTDRFASTEWLYYRAPYGDLGTADDQGMLTRLVLLAVGALGALACLALIPRRRGWFTSLGAASLVVYLFHGFFVKAASYAGLGDWSVNHPWWGLTLVTGGGLVVALVLALPPVARRLEVAVDPVGALQRRRSRARERAAAMEHTRGERENALASSA